jgi:protein SCO1/2
MDQPISKPRAIIWFGFGLAALVLAGLFMVITFNPRPVRSKALPVYGQIADFNLTNQDGQAVSLANLKGHVWVADVIFTRCPGPCLKMSRQMHELQQRLAQNTQVRLVTVTTDPEFDTAPVLKTYAGRFAADPNRWWFLTGASKEITALVGGSLKLTALAKSAEERQSPADLFIHSTIFVMVDKHGQLREIIETTGEGVQPQQVQAQLLAGILQLERES